MSQVIVVEMEKPPEGFEAPTEEQLRQLLGRGFPIQPEDRLKVVAPGTVPRAKPEGAELEEFYRRLEVGPDDKLVLVRLDYASIEPPSPLELLLGTLLMAEDLAQRPRCDNPNCPVCGPGGIRDTLDFMMSSFGEDVDCGNPDCPVHGHRAKEGKGVPQA